MAKLNYPFACGIDWLQVFVFLHSPLENKEIGDVRVTVSDYPTAQFLEKAEISLRFESKWLPFAIILFKPRTSVLPSYAAQMKLENRALYEENLMPRLSYVFSVLNIEYRSISRVDIFYDCNKFWGGRSPRQFLTDYTRQKVLKIGINRGFLNFDNFGYQVANGSKKMPAGFRVGSPLWTGCTWGSKDYIQAQIYNKSEELRKVKYKPHIVAMWEDCGLDPECVWRSEIRIKKQGKHLQLIESGDLFSLGAFEIANQERIWELFKEYSDKYFRFVFRDYHAKRQQMRPCRLFGQLVDNQTSIKRKIHFHQTHSNRVTSMVVNYLGRLKELLGQGIVLEVNKHIAADVDAVMRQIQNTFPNYFFNENNKSDFDVFRRLNDMLLRREWQGEKLDLFQSSWLMSKSKSTSEDFPKA